MSWLVANALTLALYLASALMHLRAWFAHDDTPGHARWFGLVGLAVHVVALVGGAVTDGPPGYADFLSAVAFLLMALVAWATRSRLEVLGAVLSPAAVVLLGLGFVAPSARVVALDAVPGGIWLPVHIGLVLAAVAGFFLEFTSGVIQGVVRRRLKQKKLVGIGRFPALEVLEQVQFRALVFGIACLGLGIAAGGFWAGSTMHHEAWITDPKVWFSAVVWLWYAALLQIRLTFGLHGRRSLILSTVGFVALMFSFLGLDFVTAGFHAYGG